MNYQHHGYCSHLILSSKKGKLCNFNPISKAFKIYLLNSTSEYTQEAINTHSIAINFSYCQVAVDIVVGVLRIA